MGDRPPGFDTPKTEGGCFNCGSQLHFAYACPEPTRKEPHGAEAFRQRQAAQSMHSHGGQGSPSNRSGKGLVITRYGPPPPQYPPPPPQNAWGPPGGPYPPPAQPPNTYAQQPPAPYPPPPQGVPSYPPPYPNVNPPPGVHGPPVPPPPAPSPGYGQYRQPSFPPPPPPQPYAPPGPYGPPSYAPPYQPPNPPHNGPPPPGFHGPPPPPAPPPASYPPAYGGSAPGLPPGVPPSLPPPPPASYPPAPYSSGYEPQAPYPTSYPPPSQSWHQNPPGHHHSRHRDHRDRRNDRDKGARNKQPGRGNDRHQRGRDRRHQRPGTRSSSHSRQRTPRLDSEKREDGVKATPRNDDVRAQEKDTEPDDEFSWDLEKAFVELETKPADPVGKPLAADWSDEPTIPPAYDARCVKSAFCDPESPGELTLSIRESKFWPKVKQDPIFRYRRDMVVIRFPGASHEYFTYHFSRKVEPASLAGRQVVPRGPSDPSLNDVVSPRIPHRAGSPGKTGKSVSESTNSKRGCENRNQSPRVAKRLKVQPERIVHSLPPRPMSPRPRSHSPAKGTNINVSLDPWSPQPDEAGRPESTGRYSRSPGGYRLQQDDSNSKGHFTPRDSTQRFDSGYQSGYSGDRGKAYRERSRSRRLSPPPSRRGRDDRGPSPDRSRDNTAQRKWSPSYAKARARTRSPSPAAAAASDIESADLSDLEYELLGLERPKAKKKAAPAKLTMKKRQVKLNDAFGRRW